MESTNSLHQLFKKYLDNQCSPEEVTILLNHFETSENEAILKALIRQEFEKNNQDVAKNASSWQTILNETYQNVRKEIQKEKKYRKGAVRSINKQWFRYAAAAAIFAAVFLGMYYMFFNRDSESEVVVNDKKPPQVQDVAPPASTNAVLTLANGTKIVLDNAQNGSLAVQGTVNVVKLADGKIAYNKDSQSATSAELQTKGIPIMYNTLTVPRGSKVVTITLTDGTKVWLNAESSLKYPTAFIGNERKIQITGEAYFEVVHNEAMPFKVQKDDAEVQVLGTHFNVNAYDDEDAMKITLLEGFVKIIKGTTLMMLAPGQQAQLNKNRQIILNKEADVQQAIAWKNGLFDFDNADITDIMRQLSRWYDVDVMYDGKIPEGHYIGSIRRQVNISEVLRMIELAGGIEFTIEGKKIIVKAK